MKKKRTVTLDFWGMNKLLEAVALAPIDAGIQWQRIKESTGMKEVIRRKTGKQRVEVVAQGEYCDVSWAIIDLGTHPTVHIENILGDFKFNSIVFPDFVITITYKGKGFWDEKSKNMEWIGWDYRCDPSEKVAEWKTAEICKEMVEVIKAIKRIKESEEKF